MSDHSNCTAAIGWIAWARRNWSAVTSDTPRWRTFPWDNNNVLIVVEAETEWDVEHGMMLVLQNGTKLVKVGMALESYTNPDGSIFLREE